MHRYINFKHKEKIRHRVFLTGPCSHCRKEISYELNEYHYFIKLFKYLIFPYNITYCTECPECGYRNIINEKQFKELKYLSEINQAFQDGRISSAQYHEYKTRYINIGQLEETPVDSF